MDGANFEQSAVRRVPPPPRGASPSSQSCVGGSVPYSKRERRDLVDNASSKVAEARLVNGTGSSPFPLRPSYDSPSTSRENTMVEVDAKLVETLNCTIGILTAKLAAWETWFAGTFTTRGAKKDSHSEVDVMHSYRSDERCEQPAAVYDDLRLRCNFIGAQLSATTQSFTAIESRLGRVLDAKSNDDDVDRVVRVETNIKKLAKGLAATTMDMGNLTSSVHVQMSNSVQDVFKHISALFERTVTP